MAFFLFGTLPGMEKFQSEDQSESDSASDEETATTGSNTEITTLEITLESKEDTKTLDSKTLTGTEDSSLAEHAPLTPESLEDPPNLSLFLPDSPIPVINSGSNSPEHISSSSAEQSKISKTATAPTPNLNKNSILKPKLIKKSTKPAIQPSTGKTAISKPKVAKKLEPAANKKVISKLNIAKKATKAGENQARPTPSTKPPQERKAVNGKNIKNNASKGLKKSEMKPTTISKNELDKSENISVTKKVLPSKSQSEKESTNNSPNPSKRKRPSSQPSTNENVKVPKLDIRSDKISKTTDTLMENKKSSVTKPAKTTPKSVAIGKKSELTSKAKQNKECPKPATPIKPIIQKKTPTVVPIQPKLNKNPISTKTSVKNIKSTKPVIKIKLNNASPTKQNSKSLATKPSSTVPKVSKSSTSNKPTKPSPKVAQPKPSSSPEKTKPSGRPPKPTSKSNSVLNKAKTLKHHKVKGKLKKTSTVKSGPIDFKIDPFSPIVIYTSPHLNKPDTNSHLNTPDIKKEVLLDIKLEPTEEGVPPTETTTCEVLQTYAKGEWEWMPGHPYFSPELELVRLDDCMCLN